MKQTFILIFILLNTPAVAQFAPQQGLPGSTAISATSSLFTTWASGCHISRGYLNVDTPTLGYVTNGDSSLAIGPADHSIVSLGDSGVAVLTFPGVIFNGPGPDFAVFENGFINAANDSQAFLELAFVEVSSDGVNYQRFPATSLTQTNVQIPGSGVYSYANLLNNLAGKYIGGYGTPFDLDDLPASSLIDKNSISHVRLIDVVGAISGPHASHDMNGRVVNDPFPSSFATGGFDLDAVGVINHYGTAHVNSPSGPTNLKIYPNPASDYLYFDNNDADATFSSTLTTVAGTVLQVFEIEKGRKIVDLTNYPSGIYFLIILDQKGTRWAERITRY